MTKTITPQELHKLHEQGQPVELIDVRTPVEFREVHASYARNVPLDSLDPRTLLGDRRPDSEEPVYMICKGGQRSAKACRQIEAEGFQQVVDVAGGTEAWEKTGLPVARGKKAVSLERQVRIAAGFLVLLGVVLGFAVHWGFYGLSAFVGAGLMFAGITDTCAMGMLIAKMPWNRVSADCQVE